MSISARQVLEMATINGAWDLGFADRREPSVDQYFAFNLNRNIEWEFRHADSGPGVLASFLSENF